MIKKTRKVKYYFTDNSPYFEIAVSIVKKLNRHGFIAYFAGGWVRDFLLDIPCSDIDIASNASPVEIQRLFVRTLDVGAQFGVIVVIEQGFSFEVSTFRKDGDYHDGRHPSSIVFSDAEQDAQRRDFTINGMFYDPIERQIIDFVGGEVSLYKKEIKAIGDPYLRFEEDKLRMLRAIRFSSKLSFDLEARTNKALQDMASQLLLSTSVERIWQELEKIQLDHKIPECILIMKTLGILDIVYPALVGVDIDEIKERLRVYPEFMGMPVCLLISLLMPHLDEESALGVLDFYKRSKKEHKLLRLFFKIRRLVGNFLSNSCNQVSWVYIFTEKDIDNLLKCALALSKQDYRKTFIELMTLKDNLRVFIDCIKNNSFPITATRLIQEGIEQGPKLGFLLKEAFKLAVELNTLDENRLLQVLKQRKF